MKICSLLTKAEMEADYVQVIEGLSKRGHQVSVVLHTPTTTWDSSSLNNLKIHTLKDYSFISSFSPINNMSLVASRIVNEEKIDMIYATGTRIGEGLIAGWLTDTPVFCDIRNPWSIQNLDFLDQVSMKTRLGIFAKWFKYKIEELLLPKSSQIVTYSSGIKDWIEQTIPHYSGEIQVIGPHVDIDKFSPTVKKNTDFRKKYSLEDSKIIMYVGCLQYMRGLDLMIEAVKILFERGKDVRFLIVAPLSFNSKIYKTLIKLVKKLKIEDRIIFTDYIPFDSVPSYINESDVTVIPHRDCFTYRISPTVKLFEYMACKKPVVSTNVGVKDFLINDFNSLVIEPGDPYIMAEAVSKIISDSDYSRFLSNNGFELISNEYNLDEMINKFEQSMLRTKQKYGY